MLVKEIVTGFAGSKKQGVGSDWVVSIHNFQKDATLLTHCKSKDDDLGAKVLDVKGQYSWSFKENIWQTTLFWCDFSSLNGHASFEVFWPEKGEWLEYRCDYGNCTWAATNDGFFLANIPERKFEFMHYWEH
ncbi:hypothetical protein Csa_021865 [Cucumis sativus]|nr:hypothetical protein Csa_021865 [Cucumis sativus]